MTDYNIAAAIAANGADEQEAIQGYYELLELVTDPKDVAEIQEIISDEQNHAHILRDMAKKYDGGIVEAKD